MGAILTLPDAVRRIPFDAPGTVAELIGDARVVAIGENNHGIREFNLLRDQLVRYLVSELDFSVVAYESGFAEGQLVDEWIHGGSGDVASVARDGFTFRFGEATETQDTLRWLREHNAAGGRVRFAGLDVPGSGGSGEPALRRVREYFATHAPDQVSLVDAAMQATEPYRAPNNGAAPTHYAELSAATRDAATAALIRVLLTVEALPPGPDPHDHLIARHHALGALRLDEQLREFDALAQLGEPAEPQLVTSSRDVYQAETARLLHRLCGRDERMVLMLHNGHAQRVPMELLPGVRMRSAGNYLAAELGSDYVALGVTALNGDTTDLRLNEQARAGFDVVSRPLEPPMPGSVEHAVSEGAPGDEPLLLDLRPARGETGPTHIRHAYMHVPVDVLAAYDGLICLPSSSPSSFVLLADGDSQE